MTNVSLFENIFSLTLQGFPIQVYLRETCFLETENSNFKNYNCFIFNLK